MRRVLSGLGVLLGLWVCPLALAQTTEQEAGDISEVERAAQGPLRERIAPVSGKLFVKGGRFEFSPSVTVSLGDPFFTKYILGGALTYHVADAFAVSLRGGYSVPTISSAAQICTSDAGTTRGCRSPLFEEVNGRAPGQIRLLGGLDLQWAPIYGKVSLLAERFIHFDLYAVGGVAAIQYVGPNDAGIGPNLTLGANAGVGMRFFVNPWLSIRAELRDLIYQENVQPVPQTQLRNQLLFELGVSFFLPTPFGES